MKPGTRGPYETQVRNRRVSRYLKLSTRNKLLASSERDSLGILAVLSKLIAHQVVIRDSVSHDPWSMTESVARHFLSETRGILVEIEK
jgi:hypothetical protein